MPKPLVVVIGSNGQLGSDLVKVLPEKFTVKALTHKDIDITKRSCYDGLVALAPAFIINTAAFHNLKACELEPDKAFLVNTWGTLNLARVCNKIGAVLVHTSTDHVFDGEAKGPYIECYTPNPVNLYGRSKYLGERLIKDEISRYYIIRVSTIYGYTPPSGKPFNFVDLVIDKAKNREKMAIIDSYCSTPSFTSNIAQKYLKILSQHLDYGVYHCSDSGVVSFYDFAIEICKYIGINADITPISVPPDGVVRPKYCEMSSEKLPNFGITSRPWQEGMVEYINNKYPEYAPKR